MTLNKSIYIVSSADIELPDSIDTPIPKELILAHEHTDHYSMQPAVEMSLKGRDEQPNFSSFPVLNTIPDLNQRITQFLQASGTLYTPEKFGC